MPAVILPMPPRYLSRSPCRRYGFCTTLLAWLAGLASIRGENHVRNHFAYSVDPSAHRGAAYLAIQQRLGLLPRQWDWLSAVDHHYSDFVGPDLKNQKRETKTRNRFSGFGFLVCGLETGRENTPPPIW